MAALRCCLRSSLRVLLASRRLRSMSRLRLIMPAMPCFTRRTPRRAAALVLEMAFLSLLTRRAWTRLSFCCLATRLAVRRILRRSLASLFLLESFFVRFPKRRRMFPLKSAALRILLLSALAALLLSRRLNRRFCRLLTPFILRANQDFLLLRANAAFSFLKAFLLVLFKRRTWSRLFWRRTCFLIFCAALAAFFSLRRPKARFHRPLALFLRLLTVFLTLAAPRLTALLVACAAFLTRFWALRTCLRFLRKRPPMNFLALPPALRTTLRAFWAALRAAPRTLEPTFLAAPSTLRPALRTVARAFLPTLRTAAAVRFATAPTALRVRWAVLRTAFLALLKDFLVFLLSEPSIFFALALAALPTFFTARAAFFTLLAAAVTALLAVRPTALAALPTAFFTAALALS
mmetsp:Transcript_28913/g.66853  ORF Transcript_28913/g.66853 Transcript_28913/m.66853 type:complete len:405 (-) Transcript_28913:4695-5909(-)